MNAHPKAMREGRLAFKFIGVSLVGFTIDAVLLKAGMAVGLEPAIARVISLFFAMQMTFTINDRFVFRASDLPRPWRRWATYMLAHGLGNLCNYLIFVTMVSTHWRLVSAPLVALSAGALAGWAINYTSARLVVFRKPRASVSIVRPHDGP